MTTDRSFSFIVVPDTQLLAANEPDLYREMARSIVRHARETGAAFVAHLGDIVDDGGDEEQYRCAFEALRIVREAGVPLLIAPGNHDYDRPIVSANGFVTDERGRALERFNRYFGPDRFRREAWFGGAYEPGKAENQYALLEAGGVPLLVLSLEFAPRDDVMAWADRALREHSDRLAIVVTHSYMYINGERVQEGDRANPISKYFRTGGCNDGEQMWQRHLKLHPNVIAVFSGHHTPVTVSSRVDVGVRGNAVAQLFQNWQAEPLGGGGRYRIVNYDAGRRRMTFRVFNPSTGAFEDEPGYAFSCEAG